MAKDKSTDPLERKNISMRRSVIAAGEALVGSMQQSSFSQLLTDLILDAQKRRATGGDKSPEQYLTEIVGLLAEKRALEAKIKEMKVDKAATNFVWKRHLKEEAEKKARGSAT
jgi:hypothetical protein